MLTIVLAGEEYFDEEKEEFCTVGDVPLSMEHSLVSLSKWESKFEKPFLTNKEKTEEETIAYIEFMILDENYPADWLERIKPEQFGEIRAYIESKMSGTWFSNTSGGSGGGETITSELIYYWMSACNIDMECENWHLNRLFNLIRIHSLKNEKPKKMGRAEQIAQQRALNEQRRAQMGTSG